MTFDSRNNIGSRSSSNDLADIPSKCPACQSSAITTTAKGPDVNAYWRCEKCGEVWNVSRRGVRRSGVNPWR
jgi:transposase-like protein